MHIILHQPEIPANTGNIGRTCVATGTDLHLIEPLGFRLTEKDLKRAGMDYWEHLKVTRYINFDEFKSLHQNRLTQMLPLVLMILLCSEKKVPEFLKKFWLIMRGPASASPCFPRFVP